MEAMLVFGGFFASNRDTCLAYYNDRFTTWYCCLVAFHHFFPLKSSSILVAMVMLPYYSAQLVFEVICLPLFFLKSVLEEEFKKIPVWLIPTSTLYKMSVGWWGRVVLQNCWMGLKTKNFFFSMVYLLFYNSKKNYFKDCAFFLCTSK